MRGCEDRGGDWHVAGSIELAQRRNGLWSRLGLSAEAVYWAIFAAGLVVLVLLIVEILSSLGT